MVDITIHRPEDLRRVADASHADIAGRLGIRKAYVAEGDQRGHEGAGLRGPVADALTDAALRPGDVLLLSSGRTVYELSRARVTVPPGLDVAPTVGGVSEPEAWYQTNEIVRSFAEQAYGRAHFLFAPARPSARMLATLRDDEDFTALTAMWDRAAAALVGIGAPTSSRSSISRHIPAQGDELQTAVGDVCLNFFDLDGQPLEFDGSDRMVRISPDQLRQVPSSIAVAVGLEKVTSIVGAAASGMFDTLVTDAVTASAVADYLDRRRN
nr:sugar-binding domain-containing protein [Flexivirga meconopsidis]